MAINLQKGQKIDIGLSKIKVGLGWEPNAGTGQEFDLDASAFMLNGALRIPTDSHFIFYNNTLSPDQAVQHSGDDPTGGSSDGDDETVQVELDMVGAEIQEILFIVTIHDAQGRRQNFGQVRNSYIRIVDTSNDNEIAKYELNEDFSIETAIEFGRLYRRDGKWRFEASGLGYKEDLSYFVERYYSGQVIK
jgi:tellurium resistance protein TerD